jgi:hypothetical protein
MVVPFTVVDLEAERATNTKPFSPYLACLAFLAPALFKI